MSVVRKIKKSVISRLFKGKAIIIYGPRQVGKTTLVKEIMQDYEALYLNADEPDIREKLTNKTSTELKNLIGKYKLVIIDEAQRVANIGITIKLLVDNFNDIQIIATGSSSFELSNDISEPLTGRKYEFELFSFAHGELVENSDMQTEQRLVEQRLIFGAYPEIVFAATDEKKNLLKTLATSYLYKDILNFYAIKNSDNLRKLLQALALQVGSQVSYTELGSMLNIDKNTVAKYITLLEQAFVIFRVPPFHKNKRNEIKKLNKIYFFDNGIRNVLLNNLNKLSLRNDVGSLWENFLMSERYKFNIYQGLTPNRYFWRNNNKAEIDYLEEEDGIIKAYEFKWSEKKAKVSNSFAQFYPDISTKIIHKENFQEFLL